MNELSSPSSGMAALVSAAEAGDLDAGRAAIAGGCDANGRDELGRTAIMIIIEDGYGADREWLTLLLAAGADLNLQDHDGDTALDYYSFYSKHRRANGFDELLISKGALRHNVPSAKEVRDDQIHAGFRHKDAVERLLSLIKPKSN